MPDFFQDAAHQSFNGSGHFVTLFFLALGNDNDSCCSDIYLSTSSGSSLRACVSA